MGNDEEKERNNRKDKEWIGKKKGANKGKKKMEKKKKNKKKERKKINQKLREGKGQLFLFYIFIYVVFPIIS